MKQKNCQDSGAEELLRKALENGYFETPRQTSLVQLADELGYDDQEVSVELRRILREHLEECLD
jgi:predicted DNA binding protein